MFMATPIHACTPIHMYVPIHACAHMCAQTPRIVPAPSITQACSLDLLWPQGIADGPGVVPEVPPNPSQSPRHFPPLQRNPHQCPDSRAQLGPGCNHRLQVATSPAQAPGKRGSRKFWVPQLRVEILSLGGRTIECWEQDATQTAWLYPWPHHRQASGLVTTTRGGLSVFSVK